MRSGVVAASVEDAECASPFAHRPGVPTGRRTRSQQEQGDDMATSESTAFRARDDEPSVAFGTPSCLRSVIDDFPIAAFTLCFSFRSQQGGTLKFSG
jgi:hypothetical protein